ncbi:MAG: VWA domain-containing protein [Eubacteriales bacterium]|nr:VWA domain-containing protein [Eubacteriales bacterium]
MKKSKAISLLLALSLLLSLAVPGTLALPVRAADEPQTEGMVISKTAKADGEGRYTITLEAYATGDKIITETTKDVPTDIILVLDQSGSMGDSMSSEKAYSAYEDRSNEYLHYRRFNKGDENLYYPVDGGYVQVQVDQTRVNRYESLNNSTQNYYYNYYYQNGNNLYIKVADGQYQNVTVSVSGSLFGGYTYTYSVNGTQIAQSDGLTSTPDFGDYGPIYQAVQVYQYTYYYQLRNQNRVVIETSLGEDTVPNKTYYQYGTVNTSRLEALESAVTTFANSVAAKAAGPDGILGNEDDVNHRVAVVGFASPDSNTELLSIRNNRGGIGVSYNSITSQNLVDVLQNMDTQQGQTMVDNAISTLDANGATRADLGMDMANRILNANPVPEGERRARVVVFFTDGSPTSSRYFSEEVASAAITNASSIKAGGAVVYSVGVFPGADATSNGIAQDNNSHRENQFMQSVSSNNGSPKNPSYYLSASDAGTLNSIFQQISDQIQQGGSATTLDENTVIKDIIAPAFELPQGAGVSDITLETYSYVGENRWEENPDSMGAEATVNGDKVNVTGFDFAENYVGTVKQNDTVTYRGDKLVISFTVTPKAGFLGGNNVYTNTDAGVYKDKDSTEAVLTFNRPQVNVPIKDITVTAQDKNVYLLGSLTADQLKSGATAKVGDVELDLTKPDENYGLAAWQTEYVDITVSYLNSKDEAITDYQNLDQDQVYKVVVTVKPKSEASATSSGTAAEEQSGNDEAAINVFKPELTYKDGEVYYGDTVPTDFIENLRDTKWKHNEVSANTSTMGAAPVLIIDYTPDPSKVTDGKINTKQDVMVNASVKIGDKVVTDDTTFVHTACPGTDCGWTNPENGGTPAFLLHVKTCQLTVIKSGGADNEPYVFTVKKDDQKYTEVTIVGNQSKTIYELPVGNYTIEEDTGWSWRYNPTYADNSASLSSKNPKGNITCTNTPENPYWLNGYSGVKTNVSGASGTK